MYVNSQLGCIFGISFDWNVWGFPYGVDIILQSLKSEPLEVTYSYFDGSGHRRVITVKRGNTIGEFLKQVRDELAQEFKDIRYAFFHPLSLLTIHKSYNEGSSKART